MDWVRCSDAAGAFQLWERNLNLGGGSAAGFGNGDGTTVSRRLPQVAARADRGKFQERRQWRAFPAAQSRMDCERERGGASCAEPAMRVGQRHQGLRWRRMWAFTYRGSVAAELAVFSPLHWPWWWGSSERGGPGTRSGSGVGGVVTEAALRAPPRWMVTERCSGSGGDVSFGGVGKSFSQDGGPPKPVRRTNLVRTQ